MCVHVGMFISGNVSINGVSMPSAQADLVHCSVANDPLLAGREIRSHLSEGKLRGPAVMLLTEATDKPLEVWQWQGGPTPPVVQ